MKGLRCNNSLLKTLLSWLFLPCLLVSSLLLATSSASAITFSGTVSNRNITSVKYSLSDGSTDLSGTVNNGRGIITFVGGRELTNFSFNLNEPVIGPSLIHFTILYSASNTGGSFPVLDYKGITLYPYASILSENCSRISPNVTNISSMTCAYTAYIERSLSTIQTMPQIRVIWTGGDTSITTTVNISPVQAAQIQSGVLSNGERFWLEQQLNTFEDNQVLIGNKLDDIIDQLDGIAPSQADIEEAVKNANDASREEQKQEIQDASDDAADTAESAGQQSEAQGQTLIQIISGFISAISSPTGDNCIIDVDLSLYQGGTHNNVDLCHLSPPSALTAVLSILLIVFVIRATIAVIHAMINLYREFQT